MIDLTNITQLLHRHRLKEAIEELAFLSTTLQDWQLRSDIEELQTAYSYMLQYMKQGVEDPNRKDLYQKLTQKAYKLKDRLQLTYDIQTNPSSYFETIRRKQKHPGRSFSELLLLIEMRNKPLTNYSPEGKKAAAEQHEKALVELFEKAWSLTTWKESEAEEISEFITSTEIADSDLALLVSAVTMSSLRTFDLHKLNFLYEALDHEYILTSQRALVGIALVILQHDQRINQDPQARAMIKQLVATPHFMSKLHQVQMELLLSRETEKVDKKMREEILPNVQKAAKERKSKLNFDDTEEFDENNPEWSDLLKNSQMEKQVREISELQMSGVDIYMSSFAQLKHYPFFQTMAHWFYQFDRNQAEETQLSRNKEGKLSFFDLLLNLPVFCNSDKYSFYFTLIELSGTHQEALSMGLNQQHETLQEEERELLNKFANREPTPEEVIKQYIHDLYRFFKLWRNRTEEIDIFNNSFHLWECNSLKEYFTNPTELKEIADYLLKKGYYKEAATLYDQILQTCFTEAEIWQKAGYAYQKQKEFTKAIENYLQADLIQPDSLWVDKNLAQCYQRSGNMEKALSYYRKVEELEPANLSATLHIGHCLVELKQYEEALPYFFKVEYYQKNAINAQRAIGWCSFVLGKYEEATKQYEKVLLTEKATTQDWLNAGHAYYSSKKGDEAIACYKKAQATSKDREQFIATFLADQPILESHGFSQETIYLLLDLVS